MDKKQYALKVLSLLKDSWPIAEGLSYLIEKNTFDDKILDVLVGILQYSVEKATSDIEKEKLGKAQEIFQKIKESESEQNKIDQQDIEKLESMMNAF
ncbi:MAG: hypothetical protein ACD_80C00166G0011 [uncultured bacterium (gcode 4)]|uniref:Uncharacterized protein n=1 Tax=uncultured bacterium (gcode 4) TaxID=1234023 RepID=K1X3V4_9BACT|nr:MAG: hypothetical protein ACD_80C00166G0011 [uncultured bacterium (gcode 4)]